MQCTICGTPEAGAGTQCRVCGAPLSRTVAHRGDQLPAGTSLLGGQYLIASVLGQGGFGITYQAKDQRLGLRVAIKELFLDGSLRREQAVIPPANVDANTYQETKTRFLEEAQVLARFNDPGIVRVLNYFEENDTAYLVMEFLEGQTLGKRIEQGGPLPPAEVERLAASLLQTLEVIHGAGLLHRDIKPDNIFLHHSGRVILIDFGSVRSFAPGQTMSHTRLVTPGYAPLEQYSSAAKFGPYTDIYSLGATLYHALTGTMPPPATDLMMGTALPPLPPQTPAALQGALKRAMALKVEERPQNARSLAQLLRQGEAPGPSPAPSAAPPQAPPPQAPKPPKPQPSPVPSPQPAPPRPQPRPAPAPTLPPRPLPQPPAPRPATRSGAAFWILSWGMLGFLLGSGRLGTAALLELLGNAAPWLGTGVGLFLGLITWLAMPLLLPLTAFGLMFWYTQQSGYRSPTIISASIIALALALLFIRLIRRV